MLLLGLPMRMGRRVREVKEGGWIKEVVLNAVYRIYDTKQ